MRISEAKQGDVVFQGDHAYKIVEKINSGIIVKSVDTEAIYLITEDLEVMGAEEKVSQTLDKFIQVVCGHHQENESEHEESDESHSTDGADEYDEDEYEDDYDEEDADEELYHECVEEVVEDLKDNGLVEAGEAAENILLDTEARYNAAIVDAIAKIRMFRYSEDPELLDDIEETLFTLF